MDDDELDQIVRIERKYDLPPLKQYWPMDKPESEMEECEYLALCIWELKRAFRAALAPVLIPILDWLVRQYPQREESRDVSVNESRPNQSQSRLRHERKEK